MKHSISNDFLGVKMERFYFDTEYIKDRKHLRKPMGFMHIFVMRQGQRSVDLTLLKSRQFHGSICTSVQHYM